MDVIEAGCSILKTAFLERIMNLCGYFGHGSISGVIILLLLAHGHINNNQRTKRAGITLLMATVLTGIGAELLRHVLSVPRPVRLSSHAFPSGRTGVAFASASVLTATFPILGPFFYLLALSTALSRLYFRAHFILDIIGSALFGLVVGISISSKLIVRQRIDKGLARFGWWMVVTAFGISGLGFIYSMEKRIDVYRMVPASTKPMPVITAFDFGTAEARRFLRYGWHTDELWLDGSQTVVWASGLASEMTLDLPKAQNYRFRLFLFPYSPTGPACQIVDIKVNDAITHKLLLEKGWHWYEFNVPQTATRVGSNSIQFFFDHSESPRSREHASDTRSLSVAFDKLEVF